MPSFAGLGRSKDEQRQMSSRLRGICAKLKKTGYLAGHGNAGLASNFVDLAHVKTKPGGILALVLPAACVSGSSWEAARRLLESEYEDLAVITVASYGQRDRAFSADTGMAEALVVATKCRVGHEGHEDTLFVNLYHRPRSLVEAIEMARTVNRLTPQDRHGRICVGDCETIGAYIRAPLGQGGCASLPRNHARRHCPWIAGKNTPAAPRILHSAFHDSPRGSWKGGIIPHRHLGEPQ